VSLESRVHNSRFWVKVLRFRVRRQGLRRRTAGKAAHSPAAIPPPRRMATKRRSTAARSPSARATSAMSFGSCTPPASHAAVALGVGGAEDRGQGLLGFRAWGLGLRACDTRRIRLERRDLEPCTLNCKPQA
jgi:hypothetical protein